MEPNTGLTNKQRANVKALKKQGVETTFVGLSKATGIPYATLKNAARKNRITVADNHVVFDDVTDAYLAAYRPRPTRRKTEEGNGVGETETVKISVKVADVEPAETKEGGVELVNDRDDVERIINEISELLFQLRQAHNKQMGTIRKVETILAEEL